MVTASGDPLGMCWGAGAQRQQGDGHSSLVELKWEKGGGGTGLRSTN